MRRTVGLFLILVVIGGCAHTELTRRYKSRTFDTAPPDYVQVSAFVMNPPPATQPGILSQLTREGQAALISKLGEWAKSPDELYQAMAASEKDPGEKSGTIEGNVFKKRVVFSVEKGSPMKGDNYLTPADRISALKVIMAFKDNNNDPYYFKDNDPKFTGWDKFDTQFQTVDLATLERTQHGSAGASITAGPAAQAHVPVSGTANVASDTTIDEKINLRQRYIQMTGAIKENGKNAVIYQESPVGYDLVGNFSVDFTITTKPGHSGIIILGSLGEDAKEKGSKDTGKEKGSKNNDSKASGARKVDIKIGHLRYPVSSDAVWCDLTGEYTIRHVWHFLPLYDRYDREFAEGLQRVKFLRGTPKFETGKTPENKNGVELISKRDLDRYIYDIVIKEDVDKKGKLLYLGRPDIYSVDIENVEKDKKGNIVEEADGNPLRFIHYGDAERFLVWLKKTNLDKTNLKKTNLKVGDYDIYDEINPIQEEDINKLFIEPKKYKDIYKEITREQYDKNDKNRQRLIN